jgi:hypothetical protein
VFTRPLSLFGIALVLALAVCVPLLRAECAGGVCVTHPGYTPTAHYATDVFEPAFVAFDQFVFIGPPTTPAPVVQLAGPARPPAGGPTTADDVPAGMPRAGSWKNGASAAVDPKAVGDALVSCVGCHTAPNGKHNVNLFAAGGAFQPNVAAAAIYESVKDDSMPLRGQPLAAAQKKVIADWASAAKKGT